VTTLDIVALVLAFYCAAACACGMGIGSFLVYLVFAFPRRPMRR
jgi:hypothetical protein